MKFGNMAILIPTKDTPKGYRRHSIYPLYYFGYLDKIKKKNILKSTEFLQKENVLDARCNSAHNHKALTAIVYSVGTRRLHTSRQSQLVARPFALYSRLCPEYGLLKLMASPQGDPERVSPPPPPEQRPIFPHMTRPAN